MLSLFGCGESKSKGYLCKAIVDVVCQLNLTCVHAENWAQGGGRMNGSVHSHFRSVVL